MSARPIEPQRPDRDPGEDLAFSPMRLSDVEEVAAVERSIYTAPWTEGNFIDSLTAGYCAWTLRQASAGQGRGGRAAPPAVERSPCGPLVGYFVLMAAVDEAHLLNLSVAMPWQARGFGLHLLRKATSLAGEYRAASVILEVRPSNVRALEIYRRFGFREHGVRRRYYPVSTQNQQSREDALVMRLAL